MTYGVFVLEMHDCGLERLPVVYFSLEEAIDAGKKNAVWGDKLKVRDQKGKLVREGRKCPEQDGWEWSVVAKIEKEEDPIREIAVMALAGDPQATDAIRDVLKM